MPVTPNNIITTQSIQTDQAVCTAAKTTYADATNAVLLTTAGTNGALIVALTAIPRSTVTATQLQLYRSQDAGATFHLIETKLMAALSMAPTTEAIRTNFGYSKEVPMRLEPNERLYVGIGVALAAGIVFQTEVENF
jgi:hypothetical protein